GGTTVLGQADGDTINVGTGGNAFGSVTIAGGTFQAPRLQPAGITGTNNSGLVSVLNGGSLRLTTYFIGGRTSPTNTGVVTIAGGSLDIASISGATGIGAFGGGRFEVNLGADLGGANKGGTFDAGIRTFNAVASTTTSQGIINLLGGTLTAGSVSSLASSTFAQFNMNGGVLKAGAASTTFLNANLTSATVHAGGGTIDNNGFAITLAEPLIAPAGNGVASIQVTDAAGYFTAPLVRLSGGGGNGDATAVAVLNGDGSITVVITNPGTNYTSAPTVTLSGGTTGTAATASATLNAGNIGGGVKFQGASTTTLSVANTYTGTTEVAAGTLAITGAGTLGSGAGLLLSGGTLDLGATSQAVGAVSITGASTISNGSLTGTSYAASLATGTATVSANLLANGSAGFSKTGNGVVVLSGANTYAGITSITGGTLAFSSADDLGNGSATNTITLDGGVLSFTPATAVSLVANQVVSVGASGGTIHVDDAFGILTLPGGVTASSSANLTKTGLGTLTVGATVNLSGGNLTVSSGVLNAGLAANGVGSVVLAEGATLNLYDGAATTMAIGGLTLASGSSLGFDLGATGVNDALSLTGSVAIASTASLNFNALAGVSVGTYDLLSVSAGTLNAADYVLGIAPSGLNYNFTTANDGQTLRLTTTLLNLVYWKGDVGGSWSSNNAADTNWASDLAGTTDLGALPLATDTLVFSSSGATGPTFAITLDGSVTADSLKFTANPSGVTAITISQGTGGTLTLSPVSSNNGISVATNAGAITISAPVATGATQTWEVVGGGANGSSLVVSGALAINHLINKTGAGPLTLSGNNTGDGGINFTAGTLVLGHNNALGTGTFSIGALTTLDTGASAIVNAGDNVQNWNGDFTFTGTNTLNLGAGAVTLGDNVTLTAGNALTVGGAIGDGAATFGLTKVGAGALTLNGNNTFGGGVTLTAGTLNIGHANALGAGTLTLNGGTLDNTSGGALTLGGNVSQVWNGGFTFTGTNDLVMGAGAVTLAATTPITVTGGSLTVNGAIDDGAGTFNLNKAGAGTLTLGGLNTYGGATTLSRGTLIYTADQILTSSTNVLNLGASAGSTDSFSLELNGASARFGGAMLVQTSNTTPNTITIGAGESLRVGGTFTIGFNSAANTTTRLTISGAGAFRVGDVGAPTNQGFQLGGSTTDARNNAATLDMSGLGTFYANLGTGTFRVGDLTNSSGGGAADRGSTVILAADSTIIATTITSDTVTSLAVQRIKLGSGTNILNANTISIGGGVERSSGTLDFNTSTGSVNIRALNGSGRAAMNVQNGGSGTGTNLVGTVDFTGHEADLFLSTLAVGGRSGLVAASGTGNFSFDTGTLDATTVNIAARTGTTGTSGSVTGTVNLGGGTVTIGTVTMSTNNVTLNTASGTGDATSTLNISGSGTNTITTMTMGTLAITNTTALSSGNSDTTATANVTGGTTTIGSLTMGANSSAATTVTANTATSTLNISAGSVSVTNNLTMGATTLRASNAATATINITGTGSLTVGGNIQYTNGLGTETNTVTLDGGTLDLTSGNIGASAALITFNAQAGTLRNVAEINGGGALTKTTAGVLLLDTANAFTGATTVSAGVLTAAHSSALGTSAGATSVTAGAELRLQGGIAIASEALTLNGTGISAAGALRSFTGSNSFGGAITLATDSRIHADAGLLTLTGGISGTNRSLTLGGAGNITIGTAGLSLGTGALTKEGLGTLLLSVANTYSGGTTISAGTLQIGNANALGSAAVSVASGATLDLNGVLGFTNTINLVAGATLTGGSLSVADAPKVGVLDVVLEGVGVTLTKTDAGRLELTGDNTFTGATSVTGGGTIAIADFGDGTTASPLGITSLSDPTKLVLGAGSTLEFNGGTAAVTTRSFTIGGSAGISATGTGNLEFTSAAVIATTGDAPALTLTATNPGTTNRFAASLAEGSVALADLAINGAGTWVIGGPANRFKNDVRIDAAPGATLGLESAALPADAVLNVGNNTTLRWVGSNSNDLSANLRVAANATAKLDLGNNNVTFATAPVMGSGASLQKQGSGTLNVSASAPSLNVAVSSGTLSVNGALGNVALSSGAVLGGAGTVGDVVTTSGSVLSPGNSPGTITLDSLTAAAGFIINWQVQDALDPSAGFDKIRITGDLNLTADYSSNRVVIKVVSLLGNEDGRTGDGTALGAPDGFDKPGTPGILPRTFDFMRVDGTVIYGTNDITDVFAFDLTQFEYTNGGSSISSLWSITSYEFGGDTYFQITAVPEPSTYGFGLGALALAAAAIRRRRKVKAEAQAK
ncbi:MAG: hypothetical protein RI969_1528, partial [Verrucomicrobiota bacterium]